MTNKNLLRDDNLADVRFAENELTNDIIVGKYVPYDFAFMYPGGCMP